MTVDRDASAVASNAQAIPLQAVPVLSPDEFRALCLDRCARGLRISSLSALPNATPGSAEAGEVLAVLADDSNASLELARMRIPGDRRCAALSTELPQAQAFERELHEEHGVYPLGHPWLKPLRRHRDLEAGGAGADPHTFFRVAGEGIHEVAVGPVHAGIIEPGHFRFQCDGEQVLHRRSSSATSTGVRGRSSSTPRPRAAAWSRSPSRATRPSVTHWPMPR